MDFRKINKEKAMHDIMRQKSISLLLVFILIFTSAVNAAEDTEDIQLFGFELEKLLSMLNGILALILFSVAFIAYNRDERKRLLFVSVAFFLFAVKSFLVSAELFIPDIPLIDPIAIVLESAILLSFFFGVLRK